MSGFEIVDKVKTDWRVIIVIQMCCGFIARTKSYLLGVELTSNGALIRLNGGVLAFLLKLGQRRRLVFSIKELFLLLDCIF